MPGSTRRAQADEHCVVLGGSLAVASGGSWAQTGRAERADTCLALLHERAQAEQLNPKPQTPIDFVSAQDLEQFVEDDVLVI